jgi:CheY-like chemotaxis protein
MPFFKPVFRRGPRRHSKSRLARTIRNNQFCGSVNAIARGGSGFSIRECDVNAAKFTSSGGKVVVQVRRVGTEIEIVVSDTGQGTASEFVPFVFERFRQADGSFTRRHGGLGLGLAIARHLVELHGGTITAASPGPGQGSVFRVLLPYAGARLSPTLRYGAAASSDFRPPSQLAVPELRSVRVLVVDDDDDSRDLVVSILDKCEAITCSASSAEQALSIIEQDVPDVLVSDIGMPGMDGYVSARRPRASGCPRATRAGSGRHCLCARRGQAPRLGRGLPAPRGQADRTGGFRHRGRAFVAGLRVDFNSVTRKRYPAPCARFVAEEGVLREFRRGIFATLVIARTGPNSSHVNAR